MLTINTHIIEKGSLRENIKKIVQYFIEPEKIEPMKKLYKKMEILKDESVLSYCILIYPPQEEQQTYIELDNVPEVYSYETEDTWPKTVYEFLGTITSVSEDGLQFSEKKKCVVVDNNKCYIYPAVVKNDSGHYDESSCKHVIYIPKIGEFKAIDGQIDWNIINSNEKHMSCQEVVYDEDKHKQYKHLHRIYKAYSWIGNKLYRLFHTIDSTILCLRFPFLYPRNRFTNTHYTNWKIINYCRDLEREANRHYIIHVPYDDSQIARFEHLPEIFDKVCEKNKNERCYYCLYNGVEYTLNDKSLGIIQPVIVGESSYIYDKNDKVWRNLRDGNITFTFEHDEHKYWSRYYDFVLNKNTNRWIKVVQFVNKYILAVIFCIPTHNELDAMEEGWKRNFGIRMCKDLRKQLIKERNLFSFRIVQIKEKWGELCFYVASASKETYDIISKYENMSGKICVNCGKPAKYITSGWICPYCEDCHEPNGSETILDTNGNVIKMPYDEDPNCIGAG